MSDSLTPPNASETGRRLPIPRLAGLAILATLLLFMYRRAFYELYDAYTLVDSYYTHGFLVPFISLFFAWRLWPEVKKRPAKPNPLGHVFVLTAIGFLLVGDFLGFRVFTEFSLIPMIVGLSLLFLGWERTKVLWFPLAFLIFAIPIPASITQSISLNLKLFAAEAAVQLANVITLPMVRQGSFIHWPGDRIIIGDVCGGLRSLIALLALGAVMAYVSKAKPGAKWFVFLMAAPIALISNIARIFFLVVVAYFWDSNVAAGTVHDVSGILIFIVAFGLFFALEGIVRKLFPESESGEKTPSAERPAPLSPNPGVNYRWGIHMTAAIIVVAAGMLAHLDVVAAQRTAVAGEQEWEGLDIPDYIGDFKRFGIDEEVDSRTKQLLETSEILIRPYRHQGGYPVTLTVVYAGTTRRSLHFPEVCLVGAGWEVREQESEPVNLGLTAKKLVLVKGDQQQAVLYWFKTGGVMTGNYFYNAYHWATGQLTDGSSTSAMIKLSCPIGDGREDVAFSILKDFASSFLPIAEERIP